jgi:hypothetical protein
MESLNSKIDTKFILENFYFIIGSLGGHNILLKVHFRQFIMLFNLCIAKIMSKSEVKNLLVENEIYATLLIKTSHRQSLNPAKMDKRFF